jgi:hypothetical protein
VVPPGARIVNFKARDTTAWTAGEHHLEVSLGGASVGSKTFRITAAGRPASPAAPAAAPR